MAQNRFINNDNQYYNQNNQYNDKNNNNYYNQNQYNNMNNQYYNNQNPYYNQNNNYLADPDNGKKKKFNFKFNKKILIGCGIVLAIIIAVVLFVVLGGSKSEEKKPETVNTEDRIIGDNTYGYITVPSDWLKFEDIDNVRGIQYTDRNGEYIITMDSEKTSTITAQNWYNAMIDRFKNNGVKDIATENVNVDKYEAFHVYGFHEESKVWLSVWCFETEDGITHYIGIEGPDYNNEYFKLVYNFKTTK